VLPNANRTEESEIWKFTNTQILTLWNSHQEADHTEIRLLAVSATQIWPMLGSQQAHIGSLS